MSFDRRSFRLGILAGKFGPRDVIVVDAAADTLTFRRKGDAVRDVQGRTSVAEGRMPGATKAGAVH